MSYRHLLSEDSVMLKCVYDGNYYHPDFMVYDEEGCNHIHKDNINAHIKSLVGNVAPAELEIYNNNLRNQL